MDRELRHDRRGVGWLARLFGHLSIQEEGQTIAICKTMICSAFSSDARPSNPLAEGYSAGMSFGSFQKIRLRRRLAGQK